MDFSIRANKFLSLKDVSKEYIEHIKATTKADPYYPTYHIAPHHGLMNDPNGLSFFNGEHHIFYQWFPLGAVHGLKHWYHLSTKDFVNFSDHGLALAPGDSFDKHGCFTGVGVNYDESLYLFYTANLKEENDVRKPTQILAVMDKNNRIEKKGIVVDIPTSYTGEFRDPVIIERDDKYYMIIGAQNHNEKGCLALYSGSKIDQYHEAGTIDIGLPNFGYMWECPNYTEINNQGVLIFSPQGVSSDDKYDLKNVFSVVYMLGQPIDFESRTFKNQGFIELDKGFDFYAPQLYKDAQKRTILIGWLGNSKSDYPTDKNNWAHMLTLPRELSIDNERLVQTPIAELTTLRQESVQIDSKLALKSSTFELKLQVAENFSIEFANALGHNLVFKANSDEFTLDRTNVSEPYAENFGTVRYAKRLEKEQNIQLFVDNSAIEIFADNGKTVFTSRFFIANLNTVTLTGAKGILHYLKGINYLK